MLMLNLLLHSIFLLLFGGLSLKGWVGLLDEYRLIIEMKIAFLDSQDFSLFHLNIKLLGRRTFLKDRIVNIISLSHGFGLFDLFL